MQCIPGLDLYEILKQIRASSSKRVSDTIQYKTMADSFLLNRCFHELKKNYPERYGFVIKKWLVIDVWWWDSIPNPQTFEYYWINYYVCIDLAVRDEEYDIWSCKIFIKRWDIFHVLEEIPDWSIPCFLVANLDYYILNWEHKRLSDLLGRKCMEGWVILVTESYIKGDKVICV